MSYSISAYATNQNSGKYKNAEELEYASDESITPYGEVIEERGWYEETDDEYGGILIDLSLVSKDATHIWVSRS